MKTIRKESALSKLDKLTLKSEKNEYPLRKNSMAYKLVKEVIVSGKKFIRPAYYLGDGRFTTIQDHTVAIYNVLKSIGIEYELTNDAKRGSATGNLIKIKTKIHD